MNRWISHLRRLTQLLRRRGRTPEEAEDLVQEAFLRLHVFLQEGKQVRETEAFLVRTVLNLSVDAHRREHRDLYVQEAVEDLPQRVGTPMKDIAAAVLPARDRLVELGIADEERLAVMGESYGGYCVMSLLVQTGRFRAAVASAGFANLVSLYGTMNPDGGLASTGMVEEGQGKMGGTLWDHRERYIENSPLFMLDRVTTPLLLIHGDLDATAPATLSDEIFVGLTRPWQGGGVRALSLWRARGGLVRPSRRRRLLSASRGVVSGALINKWPASGGRGAGELIVTNQALSA